MVIFHATPLVLQMAVIIQPLQSCDKKLTILIDIDAFDECNKQYAKRLLSLLLQEIQSSEFKVILYHTTQAPHPQHLATPQSTPALPTA